MTLTQTKAGAVVVIRIEGRLNAQTAPELEAALQSALDGGATKVLLDCQGMSYVSSMGLRVFIVAGKLLAGRGGLLAFASLNPQNSQIFEMATLSKLFPCFTDQTAALAEFNS